MSSNLQKIKNFILDLIFPIECLDCKKEGEWLCKSCLNKFELISEFSCPFCGLKIKNGEVCFKCKDKFILDGIIIATTYDNKVLKQALHNLKYKFVSDIAEILGAYLTQIVLKTEGFNIPEYKLIPIPLHKKRFLERGFNQSEFLARNLAKNFNLELSLDLLKRRNNTIKQASLSASQRQENIKNAFICVNPEEIKRKRAVLIDDVFTTGSTMQEAAKVLKENGCLEVWALALAHGQ